MEEMVRLVLQDLPAWMELLDLRVQWVRLVNREYKGKQEQRDHGD